MSDEFFVGYLPAPKGLKRFALACGIGGIVVAGLVATAAALTMRDPGSDLRSGHEGTRLTGVLQARPYPILWTLEDGVPTPALLVRQGKFGFRDREVAHLDGNGVEAQGLLLERDGVRMSEVASGPRAHRVDSSSLAALRARSTQTLGGITVRGEIVDSKCYLGRMRPGNGRGHRACAQLCVIGGIPPVLIAENGHGHYLVAGPQGQDVHREVVPYLAEPVQVSGRLEQTGTLRVLRIDPSTIERLTPVGPAQ